MSALLDEHQVEEPVFDSDGERLPVRGCKAYGREGVVLPEDLLSLDEHIEYPLPWLPVVDLREVQRHAVAPGREGDAVARMPALGEDEDPLGPVKWSVLGVLD